jgi:hypothetical protein
MRYFCKDLTPFSVCGQGVSGDEIPRYRSATENSDTNDINTQQLPPQFYEPGLPDGKYNYINACCPESCSDCIFKAIRAAESGDHTNPNAPGIYDADGEYSQNILGCNAVNKSRRDTSMRRVKNIRTNIPLVGRFVIKIGKKSYVKSVRELIKKSKVAVRESMI